jgi:hypothetical protein
MTDRAQHPGSLRRFRDQARDPGHDYTRVQVADLERWAWAGRVVAGRAQFFFDGISFWRQEGSNAVRTIAAEETPHRGWWHGVACTCALCRTVCPSSVETATTTSGSRVASRRLAGAVQTETGRTHGT